MSQQCPECQEEANYRAWWPEWWPDYVEEVDGVIEPNYKQKEESDQKKIPAIRKFSWDSQDTVEQFIKINDWRFYYLYLWQKWLTGDTDADFEARYEEMVDYYATQEIDYTKRLMCRCYMHSIQENYDFLDEPVCE